MSEKLSKIVVPLLDWYNKNKRDLPWRHDVSPYRVWISEIMLQQTRVEPVIPYYRRFMEALPTVEALANVPEDQLMKLWEGLGYYSRARNLQKSAKIICENGSFPKDFEGWLALPGIGEYTAGAICSIALGLPTPAVDGNVLRVLSRVLGSREDIMLPAVKKQFGHSLKEVYPPDQTSAFTQGLMELGALICLPNGKPKCYSCPLQSICAAHLENLIDEIPVKAAKKKRKAEEKTVFIIRCDDKIALQKRRSSGLLAGLWEFPNIDRKMNQNEIIEAFDATSSKQLDSSVHIFTHIEWHMTAYEVVVAERSAGYSWFSAEEILFQKAIPSAYKTYLEYIRKIQRGEKL